MKFAQSHKLPVDSVSISNLFKDSSENLEMSIQVFPSSQNYFNQTGISNIGFVLSNHTFKPLDKFGSFYCKGYNRFHTIQMQHAGIQIMEVVAFLSWKEQDVSLLKSLRSTPRSFLKKLLLDLGVMERFKYEYSI